MKLELSEEFIVATALVAVVATICFTVFKCST